MISFKPLASVVVWCSGIGTLTWSGASALAALAAPLITPARIVAAVINADLID
jgi:hypothetical protein